MTDGYTNGSTPGTNGSTTFKGNGHDAEQVNCNRRDGGLLEPYDPEIEQRLLGMLLIENSAYQKVAGVLQAQHFGNALHARFYAALGELIERGVPANPVTVRPFFEREPSLAIVGSKNYLITHYPQPSRRGTKQEHTAVSAGLNDGARPMSFASRRGREMASAILPFPPAALDIPCSPAHRPALAARAAAA